MSSLGSIPAAQLGGTSLLLADLLRHEHQRGRLLPLLRRCVTEVFLLDQARAMSLTIEPTELQQAADLWRRRRQLSSADQTQAWLAQRRLSVDDFESGLRTRLLLGKLRRHVTEKLAVRTFQKNPGDLDRLLLRVAVFPREDLVREVLAQIQEEGADFGELARRSTHASAANGGLLRPVFRCQLQLPLREALARSVAGSLVGPVSTPQGYLLVRVEGVAGGKLDARTASFLMRGLFAEWTRRKLAEVAFAAPLLDLLI